MDQEEGASARRKDKGTWNVPDRTGRTPFRMMAKAGETVCQTQEVCFFKEILNASIICGDFRVLDLESINLLTNRAM